MTHHKILTLGALAEAIGAQLIGDDSFQVHGLNTLQDASSQELAFLANPAYQKYLGSTLAGAVLIAPNQAGNFNGNKLLLSNPYLGYAKLTSLFDNAPVAAAGVHSQAFVDKTATLGEGVSVAANATVGAGAVLADGVEVGPGCSIGADSVIGANTLLHANVTVSYGIIIGSDCILHSGCVIGADGFGFAPNEERWQKIHQLGAVIIGDRVEIGACSTVDRGALGDTRIGNDVLIDNLVMIAHNVQIGDGTAIAGCTGIAGSSTLGKGCTVAGGVGISGHLNICDGTHIAAMALVTKSIKEPGAYASGTGLSSLTKWRKSAVRFNQLDEIAKRLKKLEKKMD